MRWTTPLLLILPFAAALVSCKNPPPPTPTLASTATAPTTAAASAATSAPAGTSAGGTATISGTVNGHPFNAASTVVWIGNPDDPATMAVYLFDKPMACSDLAKKGWIHSIAAGTKVYEMIVTGSAAKTYTPSTAKDIPEGSVEVNFILAAPEKNETRAPGGTVVITSVTPKASIAGTFSTTFPSAGDKLEGTFTAVYCPDAHEP